MSAHADDTAPLAPLEGFVEALERALADPRWGGHLPDAPDLGAAAPLTAADVPAAQALFLRVERTRELAAARLATLGAELDGAAPRRNAARSYAQHDARAW